MRHREFHTRSGHHHGRRFARDEREQGERRGERGHHHHHGGRSRLARFFEHGDLRLVVLQLIAEKPRHGYEIIKAVEEMAGGAYTPSPGVVYPTLTMLEELGHITITAGEGPRKLHSITPDGAAWLAQNRPALEAIHARIAEAGPGAPAPVILEAVGNLKLALRRRLSRARLEPAEAQAIAQAIDAATRFIEQD